ncbi:TerD family protein [Streptomyces flaveolus]|uniref:TerD family protein n=1 Tax=Streptomyces flaveolus TaxID=67297 RepID=UPI00340357AD
MQTTSLRKVENTALAATRTVLSVSVQGLSADVSALLLGFDGKVRGDHDLVFYNHPAQDGVSVEGGRSLRNFRACRPTYTVSLSL